MAGKNPLDIDKVNTDHIVQIMQDNKSGDKIFNFFI